MMDATLRTGTTAVDADLFIHMVLTNWDLQIIRTNKLIDSLTAEQLSTRVAPDRNRGLYLIGHLAAVHDAMLPILGLGEKLRPEMEAFYIREADNPEKTPHSPEELKQYWQEVNHLLARHFATTAREEWFAAHTAVTPEDFNKEPHRNKLNIVINRTNHLAYHLGQLIFLKSR